MGSNSINTMLTTSDISLFNSLPLAAMIIDEDNNIVERKESKTILFKERGQPKTCCLSKNICNCESPLQCHEQCDNCMYKRAIAKALNGESTAWVATFKRGIGDNKQQFLANIKTSPICFSDKPMVLILIEDITDLAEVKMASVCLNCKNIKETEESWIPFERFFHKHFSFEFSHGYCPECSKKEIEKIKAYKESRLKRQ